MIHWIFCSAFVVFLACFFALAGLCSRQFCPVWKNSCWNHSQFLDHLLQSVFITSCSVLWLFPSPGSSITYINCSPLLSLLLGLLLNWQLAFFTLVHLDAFLLWVPGMGDMDGDGNDKDIPVLVTLAYTLQVFTPRQFKWAAVLRSDL